MPGGFLEVVSDVVLWYSLSQLAAQREGKTTGWRCKKCGKMNTTTALYCIDCGGDR